MTSLTKKILIFGVPVVLILVGGILGGLWSFIFDTMLDSQLILTNSSKSYNLWKDVPVPIYMEFYMFNWTNAAAVAANPSIEPEFVEMGPYVFRERHERVNITWNKNNTVTYQQIRNWHFEPQMSNGTLEDEVTTMNIVLATLAYMLRYKNPWLQLALSIFIDKMSSLFVTRSVNELLFEGYDDKLLDILRKFSPNSTIHMPFKKVGFFVGRNNSPTFDGVFNMYTGATSVNELGLLTQWNYQNFTSFYGSPCNKVQGTSGDLWPPLSPKENKTLYIFIPDLCFALPLDAVDSTMVHGLQALNVEGSVFTFDTGKHSPASQCQCVGECQPPGTLNASLCHYGSPLFLSFPHFFLADPVYRQNIHGLKPDKERHKFVISLEPISGIPLEANARLQLNVLIENYSFFRLFHKFPRRMYFPLVWFNEHSSIPHGYLSEIRELVEFSIVGSNIMLSIAAFGIFLLLFALMVTIQRKRHPELQEDREQLLSSNQ